CQKVVLSKSLQQLRAVCDRQPPVQQHDIPTSTLQMMPAFPAVGCSFDCKALFTQSSHNEVGNFLFVFDDQNANAHRKGLVSGSAKKKGVRSEHCEAFFVEKSRGFHVRRCHWWQL